jgi:DNA-binding HxlR family transcriptional regulator
MKASYGHFCLGARALETVGDRWSLLIVRDLLQGPRRFSELTRLLTNVTPKWLTIRLRQLEADGIVERDHQPGRREVWYQLTEKGEDLRPVLEALLAWGLRYERHPLGEDEAAHPEHLLLGVSIALNQRSVRPGGRRVWRFEFPDQDGSFGLLFDGDRWSVGNGDGPADVVVTTTPRALAEFITRPLAKRRLPSREVGLSGSDDHVHELVDAFGAERARRRA